MKHSHIVKKLLRLAAAAVWAMVAVAVPIPGSAGAGGIGNGQGKQESGSGSEEGGLPGSGNISGGNAGGEAEASPLDDKSKLGEYVD